MKKSILAGMMISLGCVVFLQVPNPILGSFLFSLGLFSVCVLSLNLYTGKVGYVTFSETDKEHPKCLDLIKIFLFNSIGCIIVALISSSFVDIDRCETMVQTKLNLTPVALFSKSIFCGVFMFIAVHCYRLTTAGGPFAIILAVMGFILAGFEHSVADTYYFVLAREPLGLFAIPLIAVGNAVGAISAKRLTDI